jgi:biotin carboxylase
VLPLDFHDIVGSIALITAAHQQDPFTAILAVDDGATLLAAQVNAALGMPHNDPASALAARDKYMMRERFAAAGVPVPTYKRYPLAGDPAEIAWIVRDEIGYPCVVKPQWLAGSRGVIRANDETEFVAAFRRTSAIVLSEGESLAQDALLVERYLPGVEVAGEGLVINGAFRLLALFDKPDPLEGPFFEETIYTTPSRLPQTTQDQILARTAEAAGAVGIREGPVHAELRINEEDVWPIELAGRSIGGLCSTILEFGAGASLEEIILRHAVRWPLAETSLHGQGLGVMMIPIPKAGILRSVEGIEEATAVPHITGIEITAKLNQPIVPLPEGASYLGFIFAKADSPAAAEAALR